MNECHKTPYCNRKEAVAAMNDYNKRFEKKAKAVYKCPYCRKYHFTTMQAAKGRKQRWWHMRNKNK